MLPASGPHPRTHRGLHLLLASCPWPTSDLCPHLLQVSDDLVTASAQTSLCCPVRVRPCPCGDTTPCKRECLRCSRGFREQRRGWARSAEGTGGPGQPPELVLSPATSKGGGCCVCLGRTRYRPARHREARVCVPSCVMFSWGFHVSRRDGASPEAVTDKGTNGPPAPGREQQRLRKPDGPAEGPGPAQVLLGDCRRGDIGGQVRRGQTLLTGSWSGPHVRHKGWCEVDGENSSKH